MFHCDRATHPGRLLTRSLCHPQSPHLAAFESQDGEALPALGRRPLHPKLTSSTLQRFEGETQGSTQQEGTAKKEEA